MNDKERDQAYDDGYEAGYDAGYDAGMDEVRDFAYDQILEDYGVKKLGAADNLCLKCDCKTFGFDCVLENPRSYMERKLTHKETKTPKAKKKYDQYDYAIKSITP